MFGLFKKKGEGVKVNDKVWITQEAKWKGCIEVFKSDPETVFISWFDESLSQLEEIFKKENLPAPNTSTARQAGSHLLQNRNVVFIEHYPMRSKEEALFKELNISELEIFSALDEPLFKQFGSDKIIVLVKQLGLKETESIQHSMINNAIKRAQEKIEAKISFDAGASSQSEWLSKNFKE
ncbi:MAG: hypothetical protein ABUL41_01185 [Chitinophagaceae bacterium]